MSQVLVRDKTTGKSRWVDKDSDEYRLLQEKSRHQSQPIPGGVQTYSEVRPFISEAGACHPSQVAAFNDAVKAAGLAASITYLPDGRLRATSRAALNEEMQRRGMFNADAGYGDFAGHNT